MAMTNIFGCIETKSNQAGDSKTSCLSITIAYTTTELSGRPGKTCNTGDLNGAKTITSSFPTKLLYYNFMIKPLIMRQTELTIPAFSFYSHFNHLQCF